MIKVIPDKKEGFHLETQYGKMSLAEFIVFNRKLYKGRYLDLQVESRVDHSSIHNIIKGKNRSISAVLKLAHVFGYDIILEKRK